MNIFSLLERVSKKKPQRKFYLCMGCDALYCSTDHTDCEGCSEKTKCLEELRDANIIRSGYCSSCDAGSNFKVSLAA